MTGSATTTQAASTTGTNDAAPVHNEVTLALAKKESAEHMQGMAEVYEKMRDKPLIVKAYTLDSPNALSSTGSSTKVVHFVRHGQGFHNLMADMAKQNGVEWTNFTMSKNNPYTMPEILDSPLTEIGRQQALQHQTTVDAMSASTTTTTTTTPELIVVSPNCRALQTAVLVFEKVISQKNVLCLAHEMAREECGIHSCDMRRPKSRQMAEFPQVDFSLLTDEIDPLYQPNVRETKQQVADRIYKFMEWLSQRPERNVGVVSHSGWLLTVFNGICECENESLKEWFQTGEMRSVKLEFCTM